MMDPILKEKLLDGLQDAVSNYNSGMDEETAVAKSASDHNFNKAQTERLCELYNTSRTLYHFENNKNEKSAAFHLVNKAEVLDLLFDVSNEKMASEFEVPLEATPDYGEPETDFYSCKSAEEFPFDGIFEGNEKDIPDLGMNTARMYSQISKLQKQAEHLRGDAGVEAELVHSGLQDLSRRIVADYSAGNLSKVATVVGILTSEPEYVGVFDDLSRYLPRHVLECNVKVAHVVDDLSVPEEAKLIRKIASHLANVEKFEAEAEKLEAECKKASEDFTKIVDPFVRGDVVENEMDRFIRPDFNLPLIPVKQADDGKKSTANPASAVTSWAKKDAPGYFRELYEQPAETVKEVEDANKRLVNIHREMMLADLINNDPYLSDEDPKTIANYYNSFSTMSPELANNKEVVRSVLRQAVHNGGGGFSPFDAGSFLDAEKTLKEIRGTLPKKEKLVMTNSKIK